MLCSRVFHAGLWTGRYRFVGASLPATHGTPGSTGCPWHSKS